MNPARNGSPSSKTPAASHDTQDGNHRARASIALGMIPFDVQAHRGYALHQRDALPEMATGEGKTLVAPCPFISTRSPDAASTRDGSTITSPRATQNGGRDLHLSCLTVGCILHDHPPRVVASNTIVNHLRPRMPEFGFDYLRDNRPWRRAKKNRSSAAITSPSWTR